MARRLDDGLWQFDLGLFAPLASNVFLVDDGTVTLVDTGLPVNVPSIRSELDDAGYEVADLDRVLLTHYDLDHVGGLARLTGLDAPVHMGAADVDLVRGDWHPSWGHHKGAFHRLARLVYSMTDYDLHPVADGDRIGGFAAFLGDLVWEDAGRFTIPFWLDSYDMRELRRSVRDFADRTPDFRRGLASHGDPVLDGADDEIRALAARLA